MMSQKKIIGLGIITYGISILIVLVSSYSLHILLPDNEDWELFSFNLYGCIALYVSSIVLFAICSFLMKNKKLSNGILLIILLLLLEISSIVIAGNSIIFTIFTTMIEDENWVMIMYPIAVIIGYFMSKKALKITFLK